MKVVFLTGTRADYGKLKPLMRACEEETGIELFIYAVGMHLLKEYGSTLRDIQADGYKNIYFPKNYIYHDKMELNLAETITIFSDFVQTNHPDLIVVHGDRIEPFAGAIVGVLNNIKIAHIEGGEVTGTADEFMRHAISKLSNVHFVANEEAKYRLLQMGELYQNIHVIGSPDIDIMLSNHISLEKVKKKYNIIFDNYAIIIYHPVTTSENLLYEVEQLLEAVQKSQKNYLVIMPNNDQGTEIIQQAWQKLEHNVRFSIFKSIPFEDFLGLLRSADFIIGNSSAGVREACVYGIPSIDIGSRQHDRYRPEIVRNIQHCNENVEEILKCIENVSNYRYTSYYYGDGHSAEKFLKVIKHINSIEFQKTFVDTAETSTAIMNYINEVLF